MPLPPPLPPAFVPPPILMYHRVDVDRPRDALGRSLTLRPEQFDAELAFFRARGVSVISMRDLYARLRQRASLDRIVVATFDDGYADQYRFAVPLLRRYGDRATFYVVTGMLGRRNHLTWNDLRAMRAGGMDIGAHGVQHDDLSLMPRALQAYQIYASIDQLRDRLGASVYSYAYPSGRLNRETLQLIAQAHLPLAVTTDPHYVLPPENRFELTRLRVKSSWSLAQFAQAVAGAAARAAAVHGL